MALSNNKIYLNTDTLLINQLGELTTEEARPSLKKPAAAGTLW